MKVLKEDYGQSLTLDQFVELLEGSFNKFWKVYFEIKDTNKSESRYFALENAARKYYNKLLEDIRNEYDWDFVDVYLYEIEFNKEAMDAATTELENDYIMKEDEEI